MAQSTNDTAQTAVSVLNDLISTCLDGIEGFRTAAEAVKNGDAKALFLSRIRVIEKSEAELKEAVRQFGGDPTDHGHAAGSLHRGWMNLRSAVTGAKDDGILAEVIRGEEVAVDHYRDALKKTLPDDARALVERQLRGTEQNLDRVRNLAEGGSTGSLGDIRSPSSSQAADRGPAL